MQLLKIILWTITDGESFTTTNNNKTQIKFFILSDLDVLTLKNSKVTVEFYFVKYQKYVHI